MTAKTSMVSIRRREVRKQSNSMGVGSDKAR
jgi:hypothetical protein